VAEIHPLANLFPALAEADLKTLADDIAVHGLHEPIWLHDGRIVDGRNRYRACEIAGVQPEFRTYAGDESSLLSFVVSLNLHRRHLNESQRAMVAARLANMRQGARTDLVENSTKSAAVPGSSPSAQHATEVLGVEISQAQAAELLNVSRQSVNTARKVHDQGVPELVEKVTAGALSVSAAAAIAEVPVEEQREVIALQDEREIVRRATEIKQRQKERREVERRTRELPQAIADFPELKHYADRPEKAIALATNLRQFNGPELTMRRENLRKAIAADQRRADLPPVSATPDHYARADEMFLAINAAAQIVSKNGGPGTIEQAMDGASPLMIETWREQCANFSRVCADLAEACAPRLRRLK
jgi:ParB-like chromosome segregation protein Spo0J